MRKVGIIGFGGMGRQHFGCYPNIEEAEVVAVADEVPSQFEKIQATNLSSGEEADLSGLKTYTSAEELLADPEVDMVDVCVPSDRHAEVVIKALESGRPTLCEKPMAITLEQTDAMLGAAEQTGQPLMIAQVVRFMGPYEFLKENVEKKTWGKLLKAEFHRLSGVPRWSMGDWMRDPARSGGVPLDLHIHDVDFVHYLLGKPFIILATACSLGATKGDKDMISAAFDYGADGPKVDIEAQWTNAPIPFTAGYTAIFEDAYLIANGESLTLYENDGTISEPELAPVNGYEEEIRYFVRCVEAGVKPEKCLPESARDSVALVFAELQALKEGGQLYL